jgi:M3 family oligoendopeptidase
MTSFPDFKYQRPVVATVSKKYHNLLEVFVGSQSTSDRIAAIRKINKLRKQISTMYNIAMIRHSLDTRDTFYDTENNFFDAQMPLFEELDNAYYKALVSSKDREALEAKFGKLLFIQAEYSLKTFSPAILDDLAEENRLSSEYTRLKAQAEITLGGVKYNLSSIISIEQSVDRKIRKQAAEAKWAFFAEREAEFDRIFDELVQVRTRIAHKLGYKNFVELGYVRMKRTDYTPEMVASFRKQIHELIVPIVTSLKKRQKKRLGISKLKYYDDDFKFNSGNPKPLGTPEEIVANAAKMYEELSPETHTFFQLMQDTKLMDLVNRDGKATGGYCTYIDDHKAPFIFSNFNGTSGDIDVLTHEAGHAFQVYMSGKFELPEYTWPTYEAAEIHSMSMEFLTWPWMQLFFGKDTEKYQFSHLAGAISFLPYGVAVDEFQHIVYENPALTPAQRRAEWSKLEAKYLPNHDFDGNSYLEAGGYWQKQSHIFNSPFYYIDYTLAQICAFQFWVKDRKNHATTWRNYVKLCKAGGSASFLDLVKLAKLKSPFEPGTVATVTSTIKRWLAQVDDSQF